MSAEFSKPVRRPSEMFDRLFAGSDPAEVSRAAHATAVALLSRVRDEADADVVQRLISFTARHGIDDIAELWSQSPARSLPGSLWRLYLVQLSIHAGAPTPAGPQELMTLIDTILHGAFTGDYAVALDRTASFCRVVASGATHLADDYEATEPHRSSALTTRALRLSAFAADLTAAARLWRRDCLE